MYIGPILLEYIGTILFTQSLPSIVTAKISRFSQYWLLILAKYWHDLHSADIVGLYWHNIAHPILAKYCNSRKIEIQPILAADIGIIFVLCRLGRYCRIIWVQYCVYN